MARGRARGRFAAVEPGLAAAAAVLVAIAVLLLLALAPAQARAGSADLDATVAADLEFAEQQLGTTAITVPKRRYPFFTRADGGWSTTGPRKWTSGFLPGSYWLLYEATGEPSWALEAEARQARLRRVSRDRSDSNLGFIVFDSFGNGQRLTGRPGFLEVVLRAARSLASRYERPAGLLRTRGGEPSKRFSSKIDTLMNLELLFWAARNGGKPGWFDRAHTHALTTARDHVRTDGSTYQVIHYSTRTGLPTGAATGQGFSRSSTWSRGQAWAIHGFATAYRETRDPTLLETARRVADWYIDHLPADAVPYWDFDAPGIPNEPRDSSAAAIAASGLLDLAALEPDPGRAARYRDAAEAAIESLSGPAYLARGSGASSILLHGTQNRPRGNVDRGLIEGDYYFLEALLRYQRLRLSG